MPLILLTAFRSGASTLRDMLTLGALYALGFVAVMGLSYLVDGGGFAGMYLGGQAPTSEMLGSAEFQAAMWVFIGLHLPLSLLFWHAPALVYWHKLSPAKSMFFSIVACFRNFWAYTLFAGLWMGIMVLVVLLVTALSSLVDSPGLAASMMLPALLLVASMFFTSLYFTYLDSFDPEGE